MSWHIHVSKHYNLICPYNCLGSNVHLGGNCTTQDNCAYIVYIANEVEPLVRCGIHNRAPVK